MGTEREQQVELICQEALERQGDVRADYLAAACRGDEGLRRDVDSLLAFEHAAADFIEAPAIDELARSVSRFTATHIGARIGVYEVVAPIGSGGMGEVYRARDTKLHRDVAIKVLPALFTADLERKARFEREARMLAAVNHPHIAAIYGIDESSGVPALVLELVEGDTLAALLARSAGGRLPLQKALHIARQMVDALEAAHERGIVHRDLKPSNIKVTADDRVKVLDFGLATALDGPDAVAAGPSDEPGTAAVPQVIAGTPAYMSPEQAQGLATDKRTDVWAFGCVLYEMVSGRPAFSGDGVVATLADVLASEPDWSGLPELPTAIARLLRRCLQKDRRQRLADVADARLEIDEALSAPVSEAGDRRVRGRVRERVAWAVAAVAAIAAAALIVWMPRESAPSPVVRFPIDVSGMGDPFFLSISPDGRRVAYTATTENGATALWVRSLDSLQAHVLPGTDDVFGCDWSPDGRFLLFAIDGLLKKIDTAGGPPQTLTTLSAPSRRSSWNRDGIILFTDGPVISRIADTGGKVTPVTTLDDSLQETNHSTPWFLPDGRHFLYTAWSNNRENRAVYVGSLDSKERKFLMYGDSKAIYSPPGYILFRRDAQLMAQPFDADRLELTGDATPLVDHVFFNPELGQSAFYASGQGTLAFVTDDPQDPHVPEPARELGVFWANRAGALSEVNAELRGAQNPVLSRDGRRIAFYRGRPSDLWTYQMRSRQTLRLTTSPAANRFPIFSNDGLRLVFASNPDRPETSTLYEKPSDGAAPENTILAPEAGSVAIPRGWANKGTELVFEKGEGYGQPRDIWVRPMSSERKPYPYIATRFDERHPAISPDSRWLAYSSNESGHHEVVVQPFPDRTGAKSTIGAGRFPRWRRDGRELYYVDADGWMIAAPVNGAMTFENAAPRRLFKLPYVPGTTDLDHPYDVTADGLRFLLSAPFGRGTPATTTITVLVGWPSLVSNTNGSASSRTSANR